VPKRNEEKLFGGEEARTERYARLAKPFLVTYTLLAMMGFSILVLAFLQ